MSYLCFTQIDIYGEMRSLVFLLALFAFAACDTVEPEPEERTYAVQYDVTGTFAECGLTYFNEGQDLIQRTQALPFSESFSVTVREFESFTASIAASCSDFESEGTVEVKLTVDGDVVDSGSGTGTSVIVDADAALRLDGIEAKEQFCNWVASSDSTVPVDFERYRGLKQTTARPPR